MVEVAAATDTTGHSKENVPAPEAWQQSRATGRCREWLLSMASPAHDSLGFTPDLNPFRALQNTPHGPSRPN